jgi:predicted transcriptional regulator
MSQSGLVSEDRVMAILKRMASSSGGSVPHKKLLPNSNLSAKNFKFLIGSLVAGGFISFRKEGRGCVYMLTEKAWDPQFQPPPIPSSPPLPPPKPTRPAEKKWFVLYKETLHCEVCGESHVASIQFHHRDPTEKILNVSTLVSSGASPAAVFSEIKKCRILCANCHQKLHWEMRHGTQK